jgi:hypothetical protein
MIPILSFVPIVALIALVAAILYVRKRRAQGKCSGCGSPSHFGYSDHAESKASEIVRLCLTCLKARLLDDYQAYEKCALVIEPAADMPCYVFQPKSKWADSKLAEDLTAIFTDVENTCRHCGSAAHFLWLTSNGLLLQIFHRFCQMEFRQRFFAGLTIGRSPSAVNAV